MAIEKEVTWPLRGRSIYFRDPNCYFLEVTIRARPLLEVDAIEAARTIEAGMQLEAEREIDADAFRSIVQVWLAASLANPPRMCANCAKIGGSRSLHGNHFPHGARLECYLLLSPAYRARKLRWTGWFYRWEDTMTSNRRTLERATRTDAQLANGTTGLIWH